MVMSGPANKSLKRADRIGRILEDRYGRPAKPRKRSDALNTLIATLLSQNTNDRNSYRAWLQLRRRFPTWSRVAAASQRSIAQAIEVGGLKNQKARRIKSILRRLHREQGKYSLVFLRKQSNEEIMAYLLSIKGVGLKTAACVLVFALGRDVFPVDTHIHRICNRLGLIKTKSAEQTYEAMKILVADSGAYSFHVNLIRFGREICRSIDPRCGYCPLYDECTFPTKDILASKKYSNHHANQTSGFLITRQIQKNHAV